MRKMWRTSVAALLVAGIHTISQRLRRHRSIEVWTQTFLFAPVRDYLTDLQYIKSNSFVRICLYWVIAFANWIRHLVFTKQTINLKRMTKFLLIVVCLTATVDKITKISTMEESKRKIIYALVFMCWIHMYDFHDPLKKKRWHKTRWRVIQFDWSKKSKRTKLKRFGLTLNAAWT